MCIRLGLRVGVAEAPYHLRLEQIFTEVLLEMRLCRDALQHSSCLGRVFFGFALHPCGFGDYWWEDDGVGCSRADS